eukprot:GHVP01035888.1.p1 GENE.GHVP01035888.1~~GHVP01035888.1.p1  ORF type:complete len:536 (+),score=83.89 GHVP01035888.1:1176-2783(+)
MYKGVCVFGYMAIIFGNVDVICGNEEGKFAPPVLAVENLKSNSKASRSLLDAGEGCWKRALELFGDLDQNGNFSCEEVNEGVKSYIALGLTQCHMMDRQRVETTEGDACHALLSNGKSFMELQRKSGGSSKTLMASTSSCKKQLSDTAFLVFVEFFNHVDNICYHIQSTMWQEKTENLIDQLGSSSQHVVDQLDKASRQNELLILKQDLAIERQQSLIEDSERLQGIIEDGQTSLKHSFVDMRAEVQQESLKLNAVFTEIFAMFNRVLDFQKRFSSQLHDFGSVLFYLAVTISTYHFTSAHSTKHTRVPIYIIWIVMLLGEFGIHKFLIKIVSRVVSGEFAALSAFLGFEVSLDHLRSVIWYWRVSCIFTAFLVWVKGWWFYKDPFELYTETLKESLNTLQCKMHQTIRKELHTALVGRSCGIKNCNFQTTNFPPEFQKHHPHAYFYESPQMACPDFEATEIIDLISESPILSPKRILAISSRQTSESSSTAIPSRKETNIPSPSRELPHSAAKGNGKKRVSTRRSPRLSGKMKI